MDKPAGWLSVPGRDPKDQRNILGRVLEKQFNTTLFPVHRLDAEVSGIILYAKSREFHRDTNILFENRNVKKIYQAISSPSNQLSPLNTNEDYHWKSLLLRGKKRAYEASYGKPAETLATIIHKNNIYLDWRLQPLTGRAHQLRYEMAKHHCPIWGDTLYGSEHSWQQDGIALRALELHFPIDFYKKWNLAETYSVAPFELSTFEEEKSLFQEDN